VTSSLICHQRESVNSPAEIEVHSDSTFDLTIERGHNNYKTFQIKKGTQKILMD